MKKALIALSLVFFAGALSAREAEVDVEDHKEAAAQEIELAPAEESERQALVEGLEAALTEEKFKEAYKELEGRLQKVADDHRGIIDRLKEISGQEYLVIPFNILIK